MLTLRVATIKDAAALANIYEYYVNNTTVTFEYEAPNEKEFAARIAHKLEKYPYIVAEKDGDPVGYAYASELRERAAYGWDVELSVYVREDERGKGIGKQLYTALIEILRIQNFANLYACITCPNEPSVLLHDSLGFSIVGRFHSAGYKHGRWLDVVWLEKRINNADQPQSVIPFPKLDKNEVNKMLKNHWI